MTDSSGLCVHGDIFTDHQSANKIELSGLVKIYSVLVIWHDHTNWPTHQAINLNLGGGVSKNPKSSNRIELSLLDQYLFDFYSDLTWSYPLTHPSTHTLTHRWWGGVSTNHKSSNRIAFISIKSRFIWFLVIWHDPTFQPTHPSNHPYTHP